MADKEEAPVPLPSAPLIQLVSGATLQPPLTRRGYGPGLIIITSISDGAANEEKGNAKESNNVSPKTLDPLPQKKWAEEGYAVVQLDFGDGKQSNEKWDIATALSRAIEALNDLETCDVKDRFGLIGKRVVSACHALSHLIAFISQKDTRRGRSEPES
jgi:carboxymethylenebutenolidase